MSATQTPDKLTARQAIQAAFEAFDDFMGTEGRFNHRLLEGVTFYEGQGAWEVVIGFDAGRRREVPTSELTFLPQKAVEPIREFRTFSIDATSGDVRSMS